MLGPSGKQLDRCHKHPVIVANRVVLTWNKYGVNRNPWCLLRYGSLHWRRIAEPLRRRGNGAPIQDRLTVTAVTVFS